ncbi:MAG: hypothetical protein WD424_01975 [Paenibacillaceae bacterium]
MLPNMIKIRRHYQAPVIQHIEAAIEAEIAKIYSRTKIKSGMRIAIIAGSRGIANIARIITAIAAELKRYGADPFIVPAMGSHGGLRRKHILFGLGIVENASEETAIIEAIEPERIFEREQDLLNRSAELFPWLPVEDLDILFVDQVITELALYGDLTRYDRLWYNLLEEKNIIEFELQLNLR